MKIIKFIIRIPLNIWKFFKEGVLDVIFFAILLFAYLFVKLMGKFTEIPLFPFKLRSFLVTSMYRIYFIVQRITTRDHDNPTISQINLIDLALRNMTFKLSRTMVTIGGMAIGIGAIVFLVSLGYGVQDLVISRVARLDELQQINVTTQQGSREKITDQTLAVFKDIANTTDNLPIISLVGRVNYQNSVTDVAVYGVTTKYLTSSAIRPSVGEVFQSDDISIKPDEGRQTVSIPGNLINNAKTDDELIAQVLGTRDDGRVLANQSSSGSIELIEIDDPDAAKTDDVSVETVELDPSAKKQAVVNRAMLGLLGLDETSAVGKTFDVSFIVVGNLLQDQTQKVESKSTQYTILGVTPDDKTPIFYVPFIDLRGLGITNYSQLKTIVSSQDVLPEVRQKIESLGFATSSVVDTLAQIEALFGTLRLVLAVVGMIAVAIASLGMFNTLTVSLMERTREVGFMKALGMRSKEIKQLFLTESLIMGIFGGTFGLIFGYGGGQLVSLALSAYSLSQGGDSINISSLPWELILGILGLSLFVGLTTGLYPARRATRISALNALRYE
ncbi:ABC transporter permease [candidate division WWE3 bacterium]|nr:ABC transporter permease [candidate division WWE3 bacterium]